MSALKAKVYEDSAMMQLDFKKYTNNLEKDCSNMRQILNEATIKIKDINAKAIPELGMEIGKINRLIEYTKQNLIENERHISELKSSKAEKSLLKKITNEINETIGEKFSHLQTEDKKIVEYLARDLRDEININVNEKLYEVLDPKALKRLINYQEKSESPIKLDITNVIDELQERAQIAISSQIRQLDIIKQKLEEEEKKQSINRRPTITSSRSRSPAKSTLKLSAINLQSNSALAESYKQSVPSEQSEPSLRDEESRLIKDTISSNVQLNEDEYNKTIFNLQEDTFNNNQETERDEEGSFTDYIETELNIIRDSIDKISEIKPELTDLVNSSISKISGNLSHQQKEFHTGLSLLHGEINLIMKKRSKDYVDFNNEIQKLQQELSSRDLDLSKLELKMTNLCILISALIEFSKVLHQLLSQDEEDRQNIQLSGYGESNQKSSRPTTKGKMVVSLKPECVNCTGQNPILLTAFKMACLNYNPSNIKYRNHAYTRKHLIQMAGNFLKESWNSASGQEPFDNIALPYIAEEAPLPPPSSRRTRRSSGHFLDFNNSRINFDLSAGTPLSSHRDLRNSFHM